MSLDACQRQTSRSADKAVIPNTPELIRQFVETFATAHQHPYTLTSLFGNCSDRKGLSLEVADRWRSPACHSVVQTVARREKEGPTTCYQPPSKPETHLRCCSISVQTTVCSELQRRRSKAVHQMGITADDKGAD